jgi:hypothetical protein
MKVGLRREVSTYYITLYRLGTFICYLYGKLHLGHLEFGLREHGSDIGYPWDVR